MTYDRVKALAVGTQRAELNDLYGDLIQNTVNNNTVFYNLIPKEKVYSDRVGFRVRSARNSTADSYEELDIIVTGNSTRQRRYFPIKQLKVGVEVSGLMIESAKGPGGIGDVWAEEIKDASLDFAKEINTQLFAAALPTTSDMSGIKYLIDDGDNYATYGDITDRTAAGYEWAVATTNETAQDVGITLMRTMVRTCATAGANKANLMFVTSPTQVDKYKDLIQDLQRLVPTSTIAGFEGMPSLDGVPIVEDVNCDAGYMYCLDRSTLKMGVLKEPTLVTLPEPKDADAAYIKMYAQAVCSNPSWNYKATALTT